jgi:hypothetical protein
LRQRDIDEHALARARSREKMLEFELEFEQWLTMMSDQIVNLLALSE